jgi:hypothetical protein
MHQFCYTSISCCADTPVRYTVGASDFLGDVYTLAKFRKFLRQLARVVCVFLSKMERIAGNFYKYMWIVALFATSASGIFCLNLQQVLLELCLVCVS